MSAKPAHDPASPIIHLLSLCENIRTVAGWDSASKGLHSTAFAARFWSNVTTESESGCWFFEGCLNSEGYGIFSHRGAHRLAWELTHGPIPVGAIVRHRCDTPACVNPDHLLIGTHADNVADRVARQRSARGERNGRAKLTIEQVRVIRHSAATVGDLARQFGVDPKAIRNVLAFQTWKAA